MARNKKRDAWVAHLRVCVPIDAADTSTINVAQQKIREIANLIPGSTVEVTHAGFGRMAAGVRPESQGVTAGVIITSGSPGTETGVEVVDQPEIPAFLRRNGTGDAGSDGTGSLDPSIDAR